MTDWQELPPIHLPVTPEGWHPCSNCGNIWWETKVVLGSDGFPQTTSLDAVCSGCGFPLVGVMPDASS